MKRYITILSVMMLALSVSSCKFVRINVPSDFVWGGDKNSPSASKSYEVEDFQMMNIMVAATVHYTQNEDAPVVHVMAKESTLDVLDVKVENGILVVSSEKPILNGDIDIVVNSSKLTNLSTSGATEFEALSGIASESFKVDVSGTGDILINGLNANDVTFNIAGAGDLTVNFIECDSLSVSIKGAGDVTVNGKAGSADLSIQGAGEIDACGLECDKVSKNVQGVGKISLM